MPQPATSFGEAFVNFFTSFADFSLYIELLITSFGAVAMAGTFKKNLKAFFIHLGFHLGVFGLSILFMDLGYCCTAFMPQDPVVVTIIILFSLIPGVAFLAIFSKGHVFHRLLRIFFFLSVTYLFSEIDHNYNILLDTYVADNPTLREAIFCVPYLPLIPIFLFAGTKKTHHVDYLRASLTIISYLVFMVTFATAFLSSRFQPASLSFRIQMIIILALLAAVDLWAYVVHYIINKSERELLELQTREQLVAATNLMRDLNQESIDRTTRARHDLRNTFSYLRQMISEGKTKEALAFIDENEAVAFGDVKIIDCGNPVVSAIMNLELRKAELKGVSLQYRLVVPKELSISDSDICSLVTNILDNAMEGTVASGKEGYVDFSLIASGAMLRVQCKNPTCLTHVPAFTNKREAGHGYGMAIIKRIVKEHQGYWDFSIKDGVFHTDCVLDLNLTEDTNA